MQSLEKSKGPQLIYKLSLLKLLTLSRDKEEQNWTKKKKRKTKPKSNKRKAIIMIRTEINEIENRKVEKMKQRVDFLKDQ